MVTPLHVQRYGGQHERSATVGFDPLVSVCDPPACRSRLRANRHCIADRHFEFRAEAFNLTNTPNFRAPARDISSPNTFGQITQTLSTATVSTARTVELVFKFFF